MSSSIRHQLTWCQGKRLLALSAAFVALFAVVQLIGPGLASAMDGGGERPCRVIEEDDVCIEDEPDGPVDPTPGTEPPPAGGGGPGTGGTTGTGGGGNSSGGTTGSTPGSPEPGKKNPCAPQHGDADGDCIPDTIDDNTPTDPAEPSDSEAPDEPGTPAGADLDLNPFESLENRKSLGDLQAQLDGLGLGYLLEGCEDGQLPASWTTQSHSARSGYLTGGLLSVSPVELLLAPDRFHS